MLGLVMAAGAAALTLFAVSGDKPDATTLGASGDAAGKDAAKSAPKSKHKRRLSPQESFLEGEKSGAAKAEAAAAAKATADAAEAAKIDRAVKAALRSQPKAAPAASTPPAGDDP